MTKPPVKFEDVSKRYQLGSARGSLRGALTHLSQRLLGRNGANADDANRFWVLRNVGFEVTQGESLGIIGSNGAGKTTILKLLAGITKPTSGCVEVNGRIGALIELGAGFHPDLTGRENIYLNGVILGLSRKEIDKKFSSIVEFAELEKFIDTPVKRYSSGMYVRLGFAVAVHSEPNVLLIDEVLSVGDASFQRKCIDKVKELQRNQIPIVFVSHNFYHVQGICNKALWLSGGRIATYGETSQVIQAYESGVREEIKVRAEQGQQFSELLNSPGFKGSHELTITDVELLGKNGREQYEFNPNDKLTVKINYFAAKKLEKPQAVLKIFRSDGMSCCASRTSHSQLVSADIEGTGFFEAEINPLQLNPGVYAIEGRLLDSSDSIPLAISRSRLFKVEASRLSTDDTAGVFSPFVIWRQSTKGLNYEHKNGSAESMYHKP